MNAYAYSSYGQILASHETVPNDYKYLAKYGIITDSDDLIYVRARYYVPSILRWLTLDEFRGSVENPLSLNRYILNQGDPVNYIDINGFNRGDVLQKFDNWLTYKAIPSTDGFLIGGLTFIDNEFRTLYNSAMHPMDTVSTIVVSTLNTASTVGTLTWCTISDPNAQRPECRGIINGIQQAGTNYTNEYKNSSYQKKGEMAGYTTVSAITIIALKGAFAPAKNVASLNKTNKLTKTTKITGVVTLSRYKLNGIIKHIYKVDIGKNGVRGGHHISALEKNPNVRNIKPVGKEINGFKHVNFEFFDKSSYNMSLAKFNAWKKRPKNKGKVYVENGIELGNDPSKWKELDYFWKKKKNGSTLFPKDWDEARIRDAINEAYDNDGKGLETKYDMKNKKYVEAGYLKEEKVWIQFNLENEPNSVYPNLNIK